VDAEKRRPKSRCERPTGHAGDHAGDGWRWRDKGEAARRLFSGELPRVEYTPPALPKLFRVEYETILPPTARAFVI
jgi:hypothetical protein